MDGFYPYKSTADMIAASAHRSYYVKVLLFSKINKMFFGYFDPEKKTFFR